MNNRPPDMVQKLSDEREYFLTVNGLQLRIREWGQAFLPPMVLLHGLRGYSGTWRELAKIVSADYRMIAIDKRGRSDSDWDNDRNYYTDAYLADLEAVVDALVLDKFVLVGHSLGGTTSYVYANKHPDRLSAVVIEDIAPGSSVAGLGFERIVAEMAALQLDFASWADARAYWRKSRPKVSDEAIELRLFETMQEGDDGRIIWRYDAAGIAATRVTPDPARVVDLWPVVRGIQVPTLIIRGGESDFCSLDSVEKMIDENPMISAVTVDGASHYVHDDALDIYTQHIKDFLASSDVSGRTTGLSGISS